MRENIVNKIDEISNEMIDGIKSIVRIKSVEDTPKPGMPFGEGVNTALEASLDLASSLGFEVENVDGYAGIVKFGEGEDYLGVFGHLDVVPEEDGWNEPAYSAYEDENGRIFSRGILDNKGPVLSNLYALYALKELGMKPKKPIWIVFGTNEETGFHDMEYFLEHRPAPNMGWTPDCKWPVVYAERGRGKYTITSKTRDQKVFVEYVNEYLMNTSASLQKLGLAIEDPEFGLMQLRGVALVPSDTYKIEFVLSYPASISNEEIQEIVKSKLPSDLELECVANYDPVYFDKDSEFCKILQNVYEEVTGLDGTPVTTTGGTYAKLVPNILPFGPSFPGQKGIGHLPNEWMDRKDLITSAKIYALSMYDLVAH